MMLAITPIIITVDGPVASGKSTAARKLAKKLDYFFLSSGLLFRAASHILLNRFGYQTSDLHHPRAQDIDACFDVARFHYYYDNAHEERITFDGEDITEQLKDNLMGDAASIIAPDPYVQQKIRETQRLIVTDKQVVAEGRNMGTEIFPQAQFKFFITATPQERARRWQSSSSTFSFSEALKMVMIRDERDTKRLIAPLRIPENAFVIDTTKLNADQVVDRMMTIMQGKETENARKARSPEE